jgi:K+-transporting ATPase A subunit
VIGFLIEVDNNIKLEYMTTLDIIQIILFFALLIALSPLLGKFMAKIFMGEKHFMKPVF